MKIVIDVVLKNCTIKSTNSMVILFLICLEFKKYFQGGIGKNFSSVTICSNVYVVELNAFCNYFKAVVRQPSNKRHKTNVPHDTINDKRDILAIEFV